MPRFLTLTFILPLLTYLSVQAQISVDSVYLSHEIIYLNRDSSGTISAAVLPANADDLTILWSPETGTIADVNNGVITALSEGKEYVIATSNDGGYKDSCLVIVTDSSIYGIEAESFTSTGGNYDDSGDGGPGFGVGISALGIEYVDAGDSAIYTFTIPENAVYQIIYYMASESDNAEIEAYINYELVSSDAVLNNGSEYSYDTLLAGGTADLKAGNHTLSLYATGTDNSQWHLDRIQLLKVDNLNIPVEAINVLPETVSLQIEATQLAMASISPTDASNPAFSWTTDNSNVATVSPEGVISAEEIGTANIIAITEEGNFRDTVQVTVTGIPVTGISVSPESDTISLEENITVTAIISPDNATNDTIDWRSDNEDIATIEGELVLPSDTGWINIIATTRDGAFSDTAKIYIDRIPVESIAVLPDALNLFLGEKANLTATPSPVNASYPGFDWHSDDTEIAEVDSDGRVQALGVGEAKIIATTEDGGYRDTCVVTVNGIPVDSVQLAPNNQTLQVGEYLYLSATVYPDTATNDTISWHSTDMTIAEVNLSGRVTALDSGYVEIIVESNDGGHTDTAFLRIDPVVVESIVVEPSEETLIIGDELNISATIAPDTATNQLVHWHSENPQIASVNNHGNIMARDEGNTIIVATTDDGNLTDTCYLTIERIPVAGVSISPETIAVLIDQTVDFTATITPADASFQDVTWESNNRSIVEIDQNGRASAVGVGTTSISVNTDDGNFTATANITVNPIRVTGVSLTPEIAELQIGQTLQLNTLITPSNATDQTVNWWSENMSIAHVDNMGYISVIAIGQTDIVVTTTDGSYTDTTRITVIGTPVTDIDIEPATLNLMTDDTYQLTASIFPSNASDQRVDWHTDSTHILSVSESGLVTAIDLGSAYVIGTSRDRGFSDSTLVSVSSRPVDAIRLFPSFASLRLQDTIRLVARITPSNASDQLVYWEAETPSVASVDNSGLVTGHSAGSAVITAATHDGGYFSSTTIQVINPSTLETSTTNTIRIYPNPAPQRFTLEGLSPAAKSIRIVNLHGELVFELVLQGEAHKEILLNSLPSGQYVVIITGNADNWHYPLSVIRP